MQLKLDYLLYVAYYVKLFERHTMKIELIYDGKNYYDPLFTFMWNDEKDNFAIGIKFNEKRDYKFVIEDLINNFEKHEIRGNRFYYYTKENVYTFNLSENFNLIPRKQDFSHCVVLLDKNDNIIKGTYKQFTSELLE